MPTWVWIAIPTVIIVGGVVGLSLLAIRDAKRSRAARLAAAAAAAAAAGTPLPTPSPPPPPPPVATPTAGGRKISWGRLVLALVLLSGVGYGLFHFWGTLMPEGWMGFWTTEFGFKQSLFALCGLALFVVVASLMAGSFRRKVPVTTPPSTSTSKGFFTAVVEKKYHRSGAFTFTWVFLVVVLLALFAGPEELRVAIQRNLDMIAAIWIGGFIACLILGKLGYALAAAGGLFFLIYGGLVVFKDARPDLFTEAKVERPKAPITSSSSKTIVVIAPVGKGDWSDPVDVPFGYNLSCRTPQKDRDIMVLYNDTTVIPNPHLVGYYESWRNRFRSKTGSPVPVTCNLWSP